MPACHAGERWARRDTVVVVVVWVWSESWKPARPAASPGAPTPRGPVRPRRCLRVRRAPALVPWLPSPPTPTTVLCVDRVYLFQRIQICFHMNNESDPYPF